MVECTPALLLSPTEYAYQLNIPCAAVARHSVHSYDVHVLHGSQHVGLPVLLTLAGVQRVFPTYPPVTLRGQSQLVTMCLYCHCSQPTLLLTPSSLRML